MIDSLITVSIILPNLNTPLQYLQERVASIKNQTYNDWECIIIDGFSDNGSWEYLNQLVATDNRFITHQFKREGIYKAWNCGIELARGSFIYIATSDDTMMPEFLNKMVSALNIYPQCSIAHCCLTIIDENSKPSKEANWDEYYPGQYFNGLLKKQHIRLAPHDGILHCGLKTVYTSVTQLLIRRSVFDEVGLFLTGHGSIADFEWGMRASLVCNVLHIPEYLATWRYYKGQATTNSIQTDFQTYQTLRFFIRHAIASDCEKGFFDCGQYDISGLQLIYLLEEFQLRLDFEKDFVKRGKIYSRFFLRNPFMVTDHLIRRLLKRGRRSNLQLVAEQIKRYRLEDHIKIL